MLNSKKRSYLKSLANRLKPTIQLGKDGVSEDFVLELENQLRARELVKVSILENAGLEAKETANEICKIVRAEFVQAIGNKFVLYKKNNENTKIIFPGNEQAKPRVAREGSKKRITKKQMNSLLQKKK